MNAYYGHRNWYEHDDTPPDLCPHGVNRAFADCGPCIAEARDADEQAFMADTDPTQREATTSETTEALMRAFRSALDRIQQTEDEAKGAHLAARMGRG